MNPLLFFQGLILGFSIAAPVGPIAVLCIRRTLAVGRASGLVSSLGAASADAVYGSIAAFGLTALSGLLLDWQVGLRLAGGAFLLYLGVRTLLSRPTAEGAEADSNNLASDYASTFVLTITNPITIISFAAVFAGLGLMSTAGSTFAAVVLVLGVFLGSALWWVTLSTGVGIFRRHFTPERMRWVNYLSGVIIIAFGAIALVSVVGLVR